MSKRDNVLQGTLDLLVLRTLERGPLHGFGIAVHIQEASRELLRVEEGSLYPALHRLEQAGLLAGEWRESENRRRARFYRLTAKGRKQLAVEAEKWRRLARGVAAVLEYA
ncbi:MAG TPA: PadR family transcriptional regulator [Thermoanaerobaculia bacterium]|nr:PadR family transcriptional regulator [Thermoanaerobaculia bacterium]